MARLARSDTPFWSDAARETAQPKVSFTPDLVFVLMEMTSADSGAIYNAIKAGAGTEGLIAIRVDEILGSSMIMRDVHQLMQTAEFVVVDLTNERPNVYYELGYAHGIGNRATNILLLAREGSHIHFDISGLRVHFYRSAEHVQSLVATQLGELKRTSGHAMPGSSAKPAITDSRTALRSQTQGGSMGQRMKLLTKDRKVVASDHGSPGPQRQRGASLGRSRAGL